MATTDRQKFVEAMRSLYRQRSRYGEMDDLVVQGNIRAACEAWADATCGINHTLRKDIGADDLHHDTCRAAILKEVFDE